MPLYEYQCTSCGKLTEKRQKFSDPELTECPHCGGKLERTITAPAVQFKGGGWYADLYSSGKKPAASNASGEGSTSTDSSSKSEGSKSEGGKSESSTAPSTPSPSAPAAPASTAPSSPK